MPTYEIDERCWREYAKLSPSQRAAFREALSGFIQDLAAGRGFRRSLRVKRIQGRRGIFEMTWAPDGRATFEYGAPRLETGSHVIWRRCGTHDIVREP